MARRPGQGGRGVLRRAVALGGGLLLRALRMVWPAGLPFFYSKKAKRAKAAAAMARKHWRADAPRSSPPRRALDHAIGAFYAALLPGRRALSFLQRAFSISLQRALAFGQRAGRTPPPPPPPPPPSPPPSPLPSPPRSPPRKAGAAMYGNRLSRRATHAASSSSSSSSSEEAYEVYGEKVPQDDVSLYKDYCRRARACHPDYTVCHFCVFEMPRAPKLTVLTCKVIEHCDTCHSDKKEPSVRCNEAGCSARTRPGRDQARHVFFCHRLPPGWCN